VVRWLVAFCVTTFLIACAHDKPVTRVDSVEIPIPIEQSCIQESDIRPLPKPVGVVGGNDTQNAAAAVADARNLRIYAKNMEQLLRKCATTEGEAPK